MSETTLLQVKNLHTSFYTDSGEVKAVNGISFNLDRGKILGIVGESGSGKSVTAYSLLRILTDTGRVTEGQVLFNGENVLEFSAQKMHTFRGSRISMIFQDPMTSLNPVYTVGNQLREAIRIHTDRTPAQVHERALEIPDRPKSPIRVVTGPQDDEFGDAVKLFLDSEWRISATSDRMG